MKGIQYFTTSLLRSDKTHSGAKKANPCCRTRRTIIRHALGGANMGVNPQYIKLGWMTL